MNHLAKLLRDEVARPMPLGVGAQERARYLMAVAADELDPRPAECEIHSHVVDGEVVFQGVQSDCGLCLAEIERPRRSKRAKS